MPIFGTGLRARRRPPGSCRSSPFCGVSPRYTARCAQSQIDLSLPPWSRSVATCHLRGVAQKKRPTLLASPSEKMERLLRLLHLLLHFLLLHRQRDYVNFVLGCIFMRLYFHFVSFVALHCVWITDCPALVVFSTHEGLSVVADFAG